MIKNKIFSIILPVWNRADIVEKSIKSIIAQKFKDYELIIIDDSSEDNLYSVVQQYLSTKIFYYKIPHSGVSAARNYGLMKAKGKNIAYLDSDNVWHPDFLLEMKKALANSEAAYCQYNVYKKDKKGQIYFDKIAGEEFNFEKLANGNYIDLNTFVHTKKCVQECGGFDIKLNCLVDWDLILRITSKHRPAFVKKSLVDYYHCVAKNTITNCVDYKKPMQIIRKRYKKQIHILHDAIEYTWDAVPGLKYNNWVCMQGEHFNIKDFTAPGFPYILQIEPTNTCNLACPLCPVGKGELGRKPRHMTLEEFKKIIDDTEQYVLFLILWDWGEPFMNPELPEMIKYASERGIKTVTSTNAHFLQNEDYVKRILASGLTTLIVAVDSLDDEKYKIYRRKGDLNKVISGIKNVVELKKKLKSSTMINLRMVLMKQNEHELPRMRAFAKQIKVDKFTVKTLNPSCGLNTMDDQLIPVNPKYRRYKYKAGTYERIRNERPCERVWNMSNIFSNGDVVPCCYDYRAELTVGNALKKPFTEIWNSPEYRILRERIYYQKNEIPKCKECTINFELSKNGWFIESRDFGKGFRQILRNYLIKKARGYCVDYPASYSILRKTGVNKIIKRIIMSS